MNSTHALNIDPSLASAILELIFEMRNLLPGLEPSARHSHIGGRRHCNLINAAIARNEPVVMILPAFPAKSPNREKTLGPLPDMGEVLALKRLQRLCADISKIYRPGAELIICSDGRVFSDLVGVSDQDVSAYSRGIQKIVQAFELSHIKFFDLENVLPKASFDEMRSLLTENYSDMLEEVKQKTSQCPDAQQMFNGIHRFMFEDQLVLKPGLSRTQARQQSKLLAYQVIQRSNAWSRLLEEYFPQAVRLSIHPQPIVSQKIGIRLLASADIWRTPWHSVPVFDGVDFRLMGCKEAEALGAASATDAAHEPYAFLSLPSAIATQPLATQSLETQPQKGAFRVSEPTTSNLESLWA